MTLPLWMLLGFAVWTLLVLCAGVGVYRWTLIFRGKADLTSFPGDIAHGSNAYRRAVRAHANCVENLPVFAAIILVASAAHLNPPPMGALAVATVAARMAQTSIHMFLPESNVSIGFRFTCFTIQLLAMTAMAALIVLTALRSGML